MNIKRVFISIAITLILVSICIFVAYAGGFDWFEARFYQESVRSAMLEKLQQASASIEEIDDSVLRSLRAAMEQEGFTNVFAVNQSNQAILERQKIISQLMDSYTSLQYVRVYGLDDEQLHFSSLDEDIVRRDTGSVVYADLFVNAELQNQYREASGNTAPKIIFVPDTSTILFILPLIDSLDLLRGNAVWVFSTDLYTNTFRDLGIVGMRERPIPVSESYLLLNYSSERNGLVSLLGQQDMIGSVGDSKLEFFENTSAQREWGVMTMPLENGSIVSLAIPADRFSMSVALQRVLLIAICLTVFLAVFLFSNFRSDPIAVVQGRVKRLQLAVFDQYLQSRDSIDATALERELERFRHTMKNRMTAGIGPLSDEDNARIQELVEKGWVELHTVLGRSGGSSGIDAARLEKVLEQVLARVQNFPGAGVSQGAGVSVPATAVPPVTQSVARARPVEVEELDEAEEVEELDELDELEELEELGEAASMGEPVEVEELDEAEEVEELDELEELEELEELGEAVSMGEPVEVEELDEAEEVEELDELEELEELEELGEAVSMGEPVEVEELDEAEEVEELDELDELEELEELEELGEATTMGEPVEVEELDEAEEVEELDELKEPEELEELDELEEAEFIEELDTVDALDESDIYIGKGAYDQYLPVDVYGEAKNFGSDFVYGGEPDEMPNYSFSVARIMNQSIVEKSDIVKIDPSMYYQRKGKDGGSDQIRNLLDQVTDAAHAKSGQAFSNMVFQLPLQHAVWKSFINGILVIDALFPNGVFDEVLMYKALMIISRNIESSVIMCFSDRGDRLHSFGGLGFAQSCARGTYVPYVSVPDQMLGALEAQKTIVIDNIESNSEIFQFQCDESFFPTIKKVLAIPARCFGEKWYIFFASDDPSWDPRVHLEKQQLELFSEEMVENYSYS